MLAASYQVSSCGVRRNRTYQARLFFDTAALSRAPAILETPCGSFQIVVVPPPEIVKRALEFSYLAGRRYVVEPDNTYAACEERGRL